MHDPFLGHHAPGFEIEVRAYAAPTGWAPWARAWSLRQAQEFIAEALAAGRREGRVRVGARVVQTWSDDDGVDGPDCEGTPPADEPGGFAPFRRRRA